MKPLTLEYTAGIIDGEGSLGLHTNHKTMVQQPAISVNLVKTPESEALLQGFLNLLGGHVYTKPKEYWTKYGLNARDQIEWRLYGSKEIYDVCKILLPYLKLKQKDCKILMKFCAKHL
jgi:hypothetical protein